MSVNQAPLRLMAFGVVAGLFLAACGGADTGPETTAQVSEVSASQGLRFTASEPSEGERVAARIGDTVVTASDVLGG